MSILLALYISLLTCTPGEEIYSHYGHTAIRVVDTEHHVDWVFNYGVFNFNTDHFYAKFVKGYTYYLLNIEPYESFHEEFISVGRQIYELPLNLTDLQKQQLLEALMINYAPRNRSYLYNFVFDNCATRPYYKIKEVFGDSIISTYDGYEGVTYREVLNQYTDPRGWIGFGINMIFGSRADQPMHGEERFFLPELLMHFLAESNLSAATDLTAQLSDSVSDLTAPWPKNTSPWYTHWYITAIVLWLLLLCLTLWDRQRRLLSWWVDLVLLIIYLLPVAIATYLTFFSIHPLVGYNIRLLIFPLVHLCIRSIYFIRR